MRRDDRPYFAPTAADAKFLGVYVAAEVASVRVPRFAAAVSRVGAVGDLRLFLSVCKGSYLPSSVMAGGCWFAGYSESRASLCIGVGAGFVEYIDTARAGVDVRAGELPTASEYLVEYDLVGVHDPSSHFGGVWFEFHERLKVEDVQLEDIGSRLFA